MKSDYLTPVKVKSAVQMVTDQLTQSIISGQLRPGDKIPTEPELAAGFHVGRNTVREAVRILIAYGILEIRRPEGTFVCDTFKPQGINPMIYSLILKKDDSYRDLVDLRQVIETGTMLLLIDQGLTPEQEVHLMGMAHKLEMAAMARPADPENVVEADIAFHAALVEATGNELLVIVNDMVAQLSYGSRIRSMIEILEKDPFFVPKTHYGFIDKIKNKKIVEICHDIRSSYVYWEKAYADSGEDKEKASGKPEEKENI